MSLVFGIIKLERIELVNDWNVCFSLSMSEVWQQAHKKEGLIDGKN